MTKYCEYCASALSDNAKFCSNCGAARLSAQKATLADDFNVPKKIQEDHPDR